MIEIELGTKAWFKGRVVRVTNVFADDQGVLQAIVAEDLEQPAGKPRWLSIPIGDGIHFRQLTEH